MNLIMEIKSLDQMIKAKPDYWLTHRQMISLNSLISKCLTKNNRKNRIGVLRVLVGGTIKDLTGATLESSKQLTGATASVLIDQIKGKGDDWEPSRHGMDLIKLAEKQLEEQIV